MDMIKVKIFVFHNLPNLVFSVEQFYNEGGYREIIKSMCLNIRDIKCLKTDTVSEKDFYSMDTWEG